MTVQHATFPGVLVLEPKITHDLRGYVMESYRADHYTHLGIPRFVQEHHSRSMKGTLVGLHANRYQLQGTLMRVLHGTTFHVVTDIRPDSLTFGQSMSLRLSSRNFRQLYVPSGFAHGFCVTSDWAEVESKHTDFYDPETEHSILWNDPALDIAWPVRHPILSKRDRQGLRLQEFLLAQSDFNQTWPDSPPAHML